MDENKKLLSIVVDNKYIYGEKQKEISENKNESSENNSTEKETDDIGWTEEDWNRYWETIRNSDN